jgi:hypothetical protein
MPKEENYDRRISDLPAYQGRFFTGGAIFPDAVRKLLPIVNAKLKKYSRKTIRELAGNFTEEMDKGAGVRSALKKSAKRTVKKSAKRIVKKILTGGKKRKSLKAKKKRKTHIRRKIVKRPRTRDFLS